MIMRILSHLDWPFYSNHGTTPGGGYRCAANEDRANGDNNDLNNSICNTTFWLYSELRKCVVASNLVEDEANRRNHRDT
jgi:hypothetical protein